MPAGANRYRPLSFQGVATRAEAGEGLVVDFVKRSGARVYGLNYKDQRAAAQGWLRQLGDPYVATLVDADGKAGIDWGVYGVPETFVIDKQGVIRHKHIGPLTEDAIRPKIEPLLKERGT